MDCKTVRARLSEYLDAQLSPAEREETDRHLKGCSPCREALRQLTRLQASFKKLPLLEPSESFYEQVLRKAEKRLPHPSGNWMFVWKTAATFGVVAFVLLVTRETRKERLNIYQQAAPVREIAAPEEKVGLKNDRTPPTSVPMEGLSDRRFLAKRAASPSKVSVPYMAAPMASSSMDTLQESRQEVAGNEMGLERDQKKELASSLRGRVDSPAPASKGVIGKDKQALTMPRSNMGYGSDATMGGIAPEAKVIPEASTLSDANNQLLQKGFVVSGAVKERTLLLHPLPVYPSWAREKGLEGQVRLGFSVDALGQVDPAEIVIAQSSGFPALDRLAVSALKKWRFMPSQTAMESGEVLFQIPSSK